MRSACLANWHRVFGTRAPKSTSALGFTRVKSKALGLAGTVGWLSWSRGGNVTRPLRGIAMTDVNLDELGPVDYLVVEFPAAASNFTGEMASELLALVDAGTIRLIDILILTK